VLRQSARANNIVKVAGRFVGPGADMAKGVLVHRPDSIYDDLPWERYQFGSRYLNRMKKMVGDWIVYYEPRRSSGRMGYNSIALIQQVVPDPANNGMYIAIVEQRSYRLLEHFVPYHSSQTGYLESDLNNTDGNLNRGLMQWSVRPLTERDFARIIELSSAAEDALLPRKGYPEQISGFAESQEPFVFDDERSRSEMLVRKLDRDRSFRRRVLEAYDSRCAITGLKLINGGGRAEVEAAHIKPVEADGPDSVRNGIALSGTVHWMFDKGLIGLSDNAEIIISRHVNDPDQVRALIHKSGYAKFPADPTLCPHPAFLQWHRENRLKI
jgi:putative restriction endonuclease